MDNHAHTSRALHVLRVDGSMRRNGSISRSLNDELIEGLQQQAAAENQAFELKARDLSQGINFVNEAWIGANFTDPAERTATQQAILVTSDALVEELQWADVLVLGAPMYNFAAPAALKAWIDMVLRARVTFQYTENGPEGLLKNKRAYICVASGGVAVGSSSDFLTPYLRHALGFIGINDVEFIAADQLAQNADASMARARQQIRQLTVAGNKAAVA